MRQAAKWITLFLLWFASPVLSLIDKIIWVKTAWDNDGPLMRYNRFTGQIHRRTGFTFDDEPIWTATDLVPNKYRKWIKWILEN